MSRSLRNLRKSCTGKGIEGKHIPLRESSAVYQWKEIIEFIPGDPAMAEASVSLRSKLTSILFPAWGAYSI